MMGRKISLLFTSLSFKRGGISEELEQEARGQGLVWEAMQLLKGREEPP